jgi:peroxiredoxin
MVTLIRKSTFAGLIALILILTLAAPVLADKAIVSVPDLQTIIMPTNDVNMAAVSGSNHDWNPISKQSTYINGAGLVGPEVGKHAPDFTLKNLKGEDVALSSLRGKAIVLNFWVVTCIGCTDELPVIEEVHKTWADRQLVVLTVNVEEKAALVQSFVDSHKYTFSVLLDSKGEVKSTYNVANWPRTFFIDTEGIIRNIKVGSFANKAEIENILSSLYVESSY